MHEYLKIFKVVTQSADQALNNQDLSSEIHHTSSQIKQTVQPCIADLTDAAIKLQKSLQPCLTSLEQAEAVWDSKPQIGNVSTANIWVQLGKLSGQDLRIRNSAKKYQGEAIELNEKIWQDKAKKLKYKWFEWNQNKQKFKKDSINIFDKDKVAEDIRKELDTQIATLIKAVTVRLRLIEVELKPSFSGMFSSCCMTLDPKSQKECNNQIHKLEKKIHQEFELTEATIHLSESYAEGLKEYFNAPIKLLLQKSTFGISLDNFDETCKSLENRQKSLIETIFEDKVKLGIQATSTLMSFYNDFLEKQKRCRQETSLQRDLEKKWIDQQRQELEKVQRGIEFMLGLTVE